jgi:hypothetical protein
LLITNTASDMDQPTQILTFALAAAPTNATIATNSGIISWRPAIAQANSTNPFNVIVSDNGTPSLSATQDFSVTVNNLSAPVLGKPIVTNNQIIFQINGDSGPDYTIQASTNLTAWTNLFTSNSPALPFNWADAGAPLLQRRFYRVLIGP